jgi:hypothetical protein
MRFGLYDINLGACARPQIAAAVARAAAQRFAEAGVHRLILRPLLGCDESAVMKFVRAAAVELVGQV